MNAETRRVVERVARLVDLPATHGEAPRTTIEDVDLRVLLAAARGEGQGDPYLPSFAEPIASWHRWFAWRPVHTVDRGTVWLRRVWRRRVQKHDYLTGGPDHWWQHVVEHPCTR